MSSAETSGYAPIRIVVIDAEAPGEGLSARRDDGARWGGAWLVVCSGGAPAGIVEVPFDGRDEVPADEVRRLASRLLEGREPHWPEPVPDAELPSATVVVPTNLARPEQLRAGLEALDRLDYPDAEVVLVDNSRGTPAVGAADVVAGLSRVRAVREAVPGISAARNAGVRAARGEVVAFTDDDVRVDPRWLRALGERFARHPDEDAVTGLILPGELETPAQLWFERHYGGFGGTRVFAPMTYRGTSGAGIARRAEVRVLDAGQRELRRFAVYGAGAVGAGANMAFRRTALARLGDFDVALGTGTPSKGGEDLAMFIRLLWLGGAIGYEPAAVVFHTHRAGEDELRAQLHDYGLGFTAMLTSLVLRDPRHVLGLAAKVPAAVRSRWATTSEPAGPPPLGPVPPADLARLERAGGRRGPGAYVRSLRAARGHRS
ncbi:glycosyltransferase [Geodermatophilus normandii]|uniref:glycosyltransferase n=1 Tax=Geodermatophilus normandii TaxID=1137989 RepID=UPI00147342C4|nr:glycosyltransferase [Geodermatophilus normandii]